MSITATKVAPESVVFSAILLLFSKLRLFLRGIIEMKIKSKFFNLKSCQNHLSLSLKQARCLEHFVTTIDTTKTSVIMQIYTDGSCSCQPSSDKLTSTYGSIFIHGVFVINYIDDDNVDSVNFSSGYDFIKKGMPDMGHAVYCVTTFSSDRSQAIKAMSSNSPLPMPDKSLKENIKNSDVPVPFDAVINGAVPFYIGKTSKGVSNRLSQHLYSAFMRESNTKFHRVLRGNEKYQSQLPTVTLIGLEVTEEEAYKKEAIEIKNSVGVPGTYLCNTIGATMALDDLLKLEPQLKGRVSAEDAEELLAARSANGKLNWNDPLYAESVICNNDRNFDADEVRIIRTLFRLSESPAKIAKKLSVKKQRVNSLLTGKTYGRIF